MRPLLLLLLLALTLARAAEPPFEILPGDRVLLLGDTLLEREGTYGYLETRMHEQFADRPFTVRNLSFAGDTPLGLSRAAFDPPAKGFDRLKEQLDLVKPTVVFLGYGMAASLQELTDRSQDPTLNRDTARYGDEPMSAARFKKELGMLMDAIVKIAAEKTEHAENADKKKSSASDSSVSSALSASSAVKTTVRFVLLSPIRHEDLRATRPGLPDPAEHNRLLAAYSKAIAELAKERGAFQISDFRFQIEKGPLTDNGIHPSESGYQKWADGIAQALGWESNLKSEILNLKSPAALRAAIIAKNELFFHRWRPANSTYLTGFRKHEQGQNAREMPMFDPLIEKAEAEIERLKRSPALPRASEASAPARPPGTPAEDGAGSTLAGRAGALGSEPGRAGARPSDAPPLPTFTVADGYQIELWAENPLLEKPTQMNWDALGRLWVCSSSLYPMIAPGQVADDKILILSDEGRTGKATKSEVFARGLLIPTGVVPDLEEKAKGERRKAKEEEPEATPQDTTSPLALRLSPSSYGCYIGQSTELLHVDFTGRRRIVLSGFGTEDTHHLIHTLRWGPDGRLYFNQSIYIHSHLETPWGLVRLNSGGCLAYDPRTERLEVFAKGWINSWGHAWDRWGQSFFTDGAGGGGINWGFPGAQFVTYEGARQTVPSVSPGSYPKFAGLEIIYSPHFPADWQGNAITCDFRAHRIVRFSIEDLAAPISPISPIRPIGQTGAMGPIPQPLSGYVTKEQPDLVRTADLSFRPIDVKLGPDGALYVADWSNPVINHGEVDFRDPRRDKHMGRIWRISKKDAPLVKWEPLVGKKTPELLDRARSESAWESSQARQTLAERAFADPAEMSAIVGALAERQVLSKLKGAFDWDSYWTEIAFRQHPGPGAMVADPRARAIQMRFNGASGASLLAGGIDAHIRKTLPAGERLEDLTPEKLEQSREVARRTFDAMFDGFKNRVNDDSPRVRLEAMRALSRIPTARSAELVLDAAVGATRRDALPRVPDPGAGAGGGAAAQSAANAENQGRAGARPSEDVFYNHAAWLSINDLAQPWLDALASGAWKAEGRERQLTFALNALPPAAARGALAQVLGTEPRDFAKGPWAELIGRAGDPAALRQLFDALLVSFGTHCCPGDELANLNAIPIDDGTALRCVNALLEAARVRNQRPTGDLALIERLVAHTNGAVRAGCVSLVGVWGFNPGLDWLREILNEKGIDPKLAQSAIESARDLGGPAARALLRSRSNIDTPAPTRQQAAVALAYVDLPGSLSTVAEAISAAPSEDAALASWREFFKIKGAIEAVEKKLSDEAKYLPPGTYVPASGNDFTVPNNRLPISKTALPALVRAAREAGKRGEPLLAALTPLAGDVPKAAPGAADFKAIAARMWTNGGDAAQGELIYRRANLGCVTCHAIGGAGGVVGPSLTSLGASAPADYIIESMLVPNAKVKEGYNGVSLKLKDGSELMGIQTRETAQEVILRNVAGQETAVPKANITGKTDIGSIMPAGLLDALNDNERMNLYCFLAELGKPGPFDASKSQVARVWRLYPGTATDAALKGAPSDASANALTLVDGRLTKAQLTEALLLVTNPGAVIYAVTQFQSTGKTRLDLTGIAKAFLDGAPLTITADLAPDLPAGLHTLAVKLDVPALPEVLRAASADASFVTN